MKAKTDRVRKQIRAALGVLGGGLRSRTSLSILYRLPEGVKIPIDAEQNHYLKVQVTDRSGRPSRDLTD